MNILPVISPVETLATALRANGSNTGIVPPWMQASVTPRVRNPGIVPPWLQGGIVGPNTPVGPQTPAILARNVATVYEPQPITVDPNVPHIM